MKLVTWNVNGLRASLRKGMLTWVSYYSPDVLCLQEIKAKPEQIDQSNMAQMEGVFSQITWNPAERLGYSGVATLARHAPMKIELGFDRPEYDVEGRAIISHYPDFVLFNLYVPHGRHDHSRVPYKLKFYERLLDICDELHSQGKNIIICGDINTSHKEIDLRNPKTNQNTTGFLPEERVWIDHYLEHGFVDAYRVLYPEREEYTWWTYRSNARARNVGWRLDYYLISEALMPQVEDVVIHDEVMGSDHCPVSLVIRD